VEGVYSGTTRRRVELRRRSVHSDPTTQLNSTSSWVELSRYEPGFRFINRPQKRDTLTSVIEKRPLAPAWLSILQYTALVWCHDKPSAFIRHSLTYTNSNPTQEIAVFTINVHPKQWNEKTFTRGRTDHFSFIRQRSQVVYTVHVHSAVTEGDGRTSYSVVDFDLWPWPSKFELDLDMVSVNQQRNITKGNVFKEFPENKT